MPQHTDRRYEEELTRLRQRVLEMGGLVERQIGDATRALMTRDGKLAEATIERDHEVNHYDVDIDDSCLHLIALHQPTARDLRFITTSLKVTTDLERIGDMAVNICERAIEFEERPAPFVIDLPNMADIVTKMLRESLDAFVREDAELALAVCKEDDEVDLLQRQTFEQLMPQMREDPSLLVWGMTQLFVSKYLERIADHATNIAEMIIFMVKGKSIRHLSVPSSI